jgi:hypothetical protein
VTVTTLTNFCRLHSEITSRKARLCRDSTHWVETTAMRFKVWRNAAANEVIIHCLNQRPTSGRSDSIALPSRTPVIWPTHSCISDLLKTDGAIANRGLGQPNGLARPVILAPYRMAQVSKSSTSGPEANRIGWAGSNETERNPLKESDTALHRNFLRWN